MVGFFTKAHMCECYQIGGRFIAEDPDCPVHGREAQRREEDQAHAERARDDEIQALRDDIHLLREEVQNLREYVRNIPK